jgi:hypothetical protein
VKEKPKKRHVNVQNYHAVRGIKGLTCYLVRSVTPCFRSPPPNTAQPLVQQGNRDTASRLPCLLIVFPVIQVKLENGRQIPIALGDEKELDLADHVGPNSVVRFVEFIRIPAGSQDEQHLPEVPSILQVLHHGSTITLAISLRCAVYNLNTGRDEVVFLPVMKITSRP